jgi:hypothetical protein
MAEIENVKQLRLMVAEPDDSTYTDEMLGALIDGYSGEVLSLCRAARAIWYHKAAAYADLVDISEGGSQRKNGDLHKRALTMADLYGSQVDAEDSGANRRTIVRRLTRG